MGLRLIAQEGILMIEKPPFRNVGENIHSVTVESVTTSKLINIGRRRYKVPLGCHGLHNFPEPFYERVKVDRVTRMPITRLHLVQRCTQCGEVREVYPEGNNLLGSVVSSTTDGLKSATPDGRVSGRYGLPQGNASW